MARGNGMRGRFTPAAQGSVDSGALRRQTASTGGDYNRMQQYRGDGRGNFNNFQRQGANSTYYYRQGGAGAIVANRNPSYNRFLTVYKVGGRGGIVGGQRGRGQQNNLSAAAMDAALEKYMGDDAVKQRLDGELEAYFGREGLPVKSTELAAPGNAMDVTNA